jgi:hypothetical protein
LFDVLQWLFSGLQRQKQGLKIKGVLWVIGWLFTVGVLTVFDAINLDIM